MNDQKRKSPTLAESGFSYDIHQDQLANKQYHNMINENLDCQRFCVRLLEHFDNLLNQFNIGAPEAFRGNELELFILLNEKAKIDTAGGYQ
jgi:hypothetical protein